MIDFQKLQLKANEKYSFVGIERRDSQIIFCLPKGFDPTLFATYDSKRDLFFLFYRILSNFKEICTQKGYLQFDADIKTQDRDGVIRNRGSIQKIKLPDVEIEENIFYSKLDMIGSILSAYDKPKILSLAYRLGKTEEIDYSKLHLFLHRAVYLDNGAAYIDAMTLPRQVVHYQPTDIVGMYCYILVEVKEQLDEEVSSEVAALAEQFKHKYIDAVYGLFHEEYSSQTVGILKDTLELIDRNTALKDTDYWYFYDAIELFLYGELSHVDEGEIWGIKNFHSVWESMCLTHLVQVTNPSLLLDLDTHYLDSRTLERAKSSAKVIDLSKALQINDSPLNPDAIILASVESQIQAKKIYTVSSYTKWNDYGYKTIIIGINAGSNNDDWTRVGYIGQSYDHTVEKLQELYQKNTIGRLIIDARLPNNFYSFWDIPEQLDYEDFHNMYYFNHLFYLALEKQILDWNKFYEEILKPLGVIFGLSHNDRRANVFTHSLLRYYCVKPNYSSEYMKVEFNNFIKQVFNQYEEFFEVIDIKYQTSEYFCDGNKIEDIKRRSVRKQFVYEHLLQKALERKNERYSNLSIRSSFWLPSYRPNDSDLLEDGPTFMDGYIQLKNVNFMVVAESYLA